MLCRYNMSIRAIFLNMISFINAREKCKSSCSEYNVVPRNKMSIRAIEN